MLLKQLVSGQGFLSLSTNRDRQAAPPAPNVPLRGRPPIHLAYSNGVPLCQLQAASYVNGLKVFNLKVQSKQLPSSLKLNLHDKYLMHPTTMHGLLPG